MDTPDRALLLTNPVPSAILYLFIKPKGDAVCGHMRAYFIRSTPSGSAERRLKTTES